MGFGETSDTRGGTLQSIYHMAKTQIGFVFCITTPFKVVAPFLAHSVHMQSS